MGSAFGKSGSDGKHEARLSRNITKQAWPLAKDMYGAGQEMMETGMPVYNQVAGGLSDFLGGGYDYTTSPAWEPGKLAAERAYQQQQQNILSNMPAGGGMQEAMTQADIARGTNLTNLAGDIGMDQYNKAYNFGLAAPQLGANVALGSLGQSAGMGANMANLAGTRAQAAAQEQAGKYGKGGDVGLGAGMLLGGK